MKPRNSENGEPPEDTALVDTAFTTLADTKRRHALYYLRMKETTTLDELATVLTGWLRAHEDDAAIATPDDRKRIRVKLHHLHLPKLVDAGFVRYDSESGEVALAPLPGFLDAALDRSLALEREASDHPSDAHHNRRYRG